MFASLATLVRSQLVTEFALLAQLELLILYILVYFSGFLNECLIFYELFCEEPSALRKYALTVVRGLR